jgi:hypothetical protein
METLPICRRVTGLGAPGAEEWESGMVLVPMKRAAGSTVLSREIKDAQKTFTV